MAETSVWSILTQSEPHFTQSQVALIGPLTVVAFSLCGPPDRAFRHLGALSHASPLGRAPYRRAGHWGASLAASSASRRRTGRPRPLPATGPFLPTGGAARHPGAALRRPGSAYTGAAVRRLATDHAEARSKSICIQVWLASLAAGQAAAPCGGTPGANRRLEPRRAAVIRLFGLSSCAVLAPSWASSPRRRRCCRRSRS